MRRKLPKCFSSVGLPKRYDAELAKLSNQHVNLGLYLRRLDDLNF